MSLINRASVLAALILVASAAFAQSDKPWDGFYFGLNAGGVSSKACDRWSIPGPAAGSAGFSLSACPGSAFVGGAQFGENFERGKLVYGLDIDIDAWLSKNDGQTLVYGGGAAPAGTYHTLGRLTPSDLIFIGPRIGYGGGNWFPYVKGGGLITTGSHAEGLGYTPSGSTKPLVSFQGGSNYETAGWAAGAGIEVGLRGALSLSAEFLHADLGRGSQNAATCSGTAAACAQVAGFGLVSSHDNFTANLFRIGVNYYFQYWTP
jgi:outer membrane immunogenic protein